MIDIGTGIRCFNEGDFFEAHEAWEREWRNAPDSPERHFLQGMIMIAAALHHHRKGEYPGALRLLGRGLEILTQYREADVEIEKEDFIRAAAALYERCKETCRELSREDFPRIRQARQSP